jgi:hypothetical protein
VKVTQLLEAKVVPVWVKPEDSAFKALVKRFGFQCLMKPSEYKGRWVIGGELKDKASGDMMLSLDKRVTGLQRAVAKHLFDLHQKGFEVVTYSARALNRFTVQHDPHFIYAGDSLSHIEDMVKAQLYVNTGAEKLVFFQYGLAPPKAEEKPAEKKPGAIRVVKGQK